jgi:tetratricopeptide (TPR) repeat protein
MSLLVDSGRTEVALTVAEARVKAKDSARNRVAAAKTCDRLGRLDKAQAHLDAALRIAPNDYLANLVAAIITLKAGQDESSLKRAASFIERASRVEGRPASKSEWIDWTMTTGILYGLAGDADTARRKFKQVLESEPDNAAAKEGLSIVGN